MRLNKVEIICIGISTGGPGTLKKLLPNIGNKTGKFPPVIIAQHIPEGFSQELAKSLDAISKIRVCEAKNDDLIEENKIYLAPGNKNISIKKIDFDENRISIKRKESGMLYAPSVDLLFESVVNAYRENTIAAIMTGMGSDGVKGISCVFKRGGITLGQDEKSSVIYGMAKVANSQGVILKELNLDGFAYFINRLVEGDKNERNKLLFN